MSFRSVVNGECFEEASFNNTLSDSFQEPAVSNMSVAMVTAACLCSASHIYVFHGPPSFYRWRGLKNILHWEQNAALALHCGSCTSSTSFRLACWKQISKGVFTHMYKEGIFKAKGWWDSQVPLQTWLSSLPPVSVPPNSTYLQRNELPHGWWGCRSCCSVLSLSPLFGGKEGWGPKGHVSGP